MTIHQYRNWFNSLVVPIPRKGHYYLNRLMFIGVGLALGIAMYWGK